MSEVRNWLEGIGLAQCEFFARTPGSLWLDIVPSQSIR
jgi:hypothetical protein